MSTENKHKTGRYFGKILDILALFFIAGDTRHSRKKETTETLPESIEIAPDDASAYNNSGITYYDKKEYGKAIEAYLKAIEADPNIVELYNNLGLAYENKKEHGKAIETYLKAIETDPQFANTYNNLGITYYNKKEYGKAIDAYLKAIETDPQYADAYYNSGIAYLDIKDWTNAEKHLNQVLVLKPEDKITKKIIAKLKKLQAADAASKNR